MLATSAGSAEAATAFLLASEVAALLRCTPQAVTKRCRKGVYEGAVRHERYWLIPTRAIEAVITPRPQAPTSPAVPATCSVAGTAAPIEGGTSK